MEDRLGIYKPTLGLRTQTNQREKNAGSATQDHDSYVMNCVQSRQDRTQIQTLGCNKKKDNEGSENTQGTQVTQINMMPQGKHTVHGITRLSQ